MFEFLSNVQLNVMLFLSGSCAVLGLLALITRTQTRNRKYTLVSMEFGASLLLLSDYCAYIFRGDMSTRGYWMVRITNFLVFALSLHIIHEFNLYLMGLIKDLSRSEKPLRILFICEIIYGIGEFLLVVNLFTGMYYTIDYSNKYARSGGYIISLLFPLSITLLQMVAIVRHRRTLGRERFTPLFLFMILPYVATLIQIFAYGLSLTNITVVGMCVVLYMFELRELNKLQLSKLAAEQAVNERSRFLANMSDEMFTPINTILGMDEMLLREDPAGVPRPYYISMLNYGLDIRNAAESLLSLITDILSISRIEAGKIELKECGYDIQELLSSIIPIINTRSNEKDLTFDLDIDENLPTVLFGDVDKIRQIVTNLLTNAVKYTEQGTITLTVKLTDKTSSRCSLCFSVRDTGIGIKPDDMEKLFSAFEQLDSSVISSMKGSGLGLAISRRFADLMGGKLSCESVHGEGSNFIFIVEQKVIDSTPIGTFGKDLSAPEKGPYIPFFNAPDARLLVVDDSFNNLAVIKNLLTSTNMQITTATSGEECLELLRNNSFDLVLLDHMMPGMDGIQTLEQIRRTQPDLPVLALTSGFAADSETFYSSKGFNGVITKPVDTRGMERTLAKYLPKDLVEKPEAVVLNERTQTTSADLSWLNNTEGIDVEAGIKNSGGVDQYFFSLKLFLDTIDETARMIEKAYADEDIRFYTVKLHALRTSARFIGAAKLEEMALGLENAGKKMDIDYINANHTQLVSTYLEFKDKLSRISDNV